MAKKKSTKPFCMCSGRKTFMVQQPGYRPLKPGRGTVHPIPMVAVPWACPKCGSRRETIRGVMPKGPIRLVLDRRI